MRNLFFDVNRPNFTKYGIMGFTISHELAHTIEYVHNVFDKEGKIVNGWSERSNNFYNDVGKCLMNQYNNYTNSTEDTVRLSVYNKYVKYPYIFAVNHSNHSLIICRVHHPSEKILQIILA